MGRQLTYPITAQIRDGDITDAMLATQPKGYIIPLNMNATNPTAGLTYYFGAPMATAPTTTVNLRKIKIPKNGTITAVSVKASVFTTLGTAEASTLYIRLNNTTDYAIDTVMNMSAITYAAVNSSLSIPLVAGDEIEMKWVTPAWVTTPTNMPMSVILYIT